MISSCSNPPPKSKTNGIQINLYIIVSGIYAILCDSVGNGSPWMFFGARCVVKAIADYFLINYCVSFLFHSPPEGRVAAEME